MRHTFWAHIYSSTIQQKLVYKIFLQEGAGALGSGTGKESQKPRSILKTMYIIYLLRIFALPAI